MIRESSPRPATSAAGTERTFTPAWWIPGAHMRTLWGKFFRPLPRVAARRECWETPDGDFIEVHRLAGSPDKPRLLILHGLEGSPRSHYAAGMLAAAARVKWGADLLVFRSCGAEMNRLPRFYHSGETTDLDFVVRRIVSEQPDRPLVATGISLGGNVLLKWLGEQGDSAPAQLRAAATVSVPYNLGQATRYITRGVSRMYEVNFLRSLRRKARLKRASFPDLISEQDIASARTLWEFDDRITAPLHGFAGADDYYTQSSSIHFLPHIRRRTLLLSARDDPFMPPEMLDDIVPVVRGNPALELEIVEHGGHVGFIGGSVPWKPFYYAERRVMSYLAAGVDDDTTR